MASGELWVAINRARATPIAGARAHVESGTVVVLQLRICCSRVQLQDRHSFTAFINA